MPDSCPSSRSNWASHPDLADAVEGPSADQLASTLATVPESK